MRPARRSPHAVALVSAGIALVSLASAGCGQLARLSQDPVANPGWPMFRHDPMHTGRSPAVGPKRAPTMSVIRFPAPGSLARTIAIGRDGGLYVSAAWQVYSLWPDGKIRWVFDSAQAKGQFDPELGSPTIGPDGTIYSVASESAVDHGFCAITPAGKQKWWFGFSQWEEATALTVDSEGTIYVAIKPRTLIAVGADGRRKWEVRVTRGTSPAISREGVLYVGSAKLVALDRKGRRMWRFDAKSWVDGPAIGDDGTIYFGTYAGKFYAVAPNGKARWVFDTHRPSGYGGPICTPAIAADGSVYFGYDKIYALTQAGALKWTYPIGEEGSEETTGAARPLWPPSVEDMIVDRDGSLYFKAGYPSRVLTAVDSRGKKMWALSVGEMTESFLAMGPDGTIYVRSGDGLAAVSGRH